MKSTLQKIYEFVFQAFDADEAYSAVEAGFIASQAERAVERVQRLVDEYKSWSGGWPPCDLDQINTYVTMALSTDLYSEDEARKLLIEWGQAEENFQ